MTECNIQMGDLAAISGAVLAEIVIGVLCDLVGPRLSHAGLLLVTAPIIFAAGLVTNAVGFIAFRYKILIDVQFSSVCHGQLGPHT